MGNFCGSARAKTIYTFTAASLAALSNTAHCQATRHVHEAAVLPGSVHNEPVLSGFGVREGFVLPGDFKVAIQVPADAENSEAMSGKVHLKAVLLGPGQAATSPSAGKGCINQTAGTMPLRVTRDQAFVSFPVNQSKLNMLVDTGDFVTALTPEAVKRLALPRSSHPGMQMTGLTGAYEASVVDAADVQFVGHDMKNLAFPVLPSGEFAPSEHTDGLFGANFLSAYDVELDFSGKQLAFYGTLSNCSWAGPQWTQNATKYTATNIGYHLLLIPILVNGVQLNALIDSGSEVTSITAEAAITLGITKALTRHDADVTQSGLGETSSRLHIFRTIKVGSTTFNGPQLAIDDGPSIQQEQNMSAASPSQTGGKRSVTAAILGPASPDRRRMFLIYQRHALFSSNARLDIILGADFLFKKKIYLAYHQDAVFIN